MKFAILTTTYKRPAELLRAIESVRSQSFADYVHYIVSDSPGHDYSEVERDITSDPKIVYIKNTENIGKNASLNFILDRLENEAFNGYVIYLDDDDWLAPECLADFELTIQQNPNKSWFVSNRVLESGESLTKNTTGKKSISYFYDYLLFKKFAGDATHCINFARASRARFPAHIKNGEEWYYFLQASKYCGRFVYNLVIGTYTQGYSPDGQNAAMQESYRENTYKLFKEPRTGQITIYLILRFVSLFIKKIF